MTDVAFLLGLGSRYSYLASTQIARLEDETGARFVWMPVNTSELIMAAHEGTSPFAGKLTGQYDPAYRHRDALRWAKMYGVPYHEPHPAGITGDRMAITAWCFEDDETRAEVCKALLHAVYGEGEEIGPMLLATIAEEFGLTGDDYIAAQSAATARHDAAVKRALTAGAFGVPSFIAGDEVFWGNDRLDLLAHHLAQPT